MKKKNRKPGDWMPEALRVPKDHFKPKKPECSEWSVQAFALARATANARKRRFNKLAFRAGAWERNANNRKRERSERAAELQKKYRISNETKKKTTE